MLGCKHQESKKIVALLIIVAPPITTFLIPDIGQCMKQKIAGIGMHLMVVVCSEDEVIF